MDKKDLKQKDARVPTIKELTEKIESLENDWKRALADYKNLQRRTLKEKEEAIRFSNYVLVSELIPVYDNLKMVEKHSEDSGLKMVMDQLEEILEAVGVKELEVEGKDFDEKIMEAVETKKGKPGKILEVLQNGYTFKDRLIRPAKVVVGKDERKEKTHPSDFIDKSD